MSPSPRHFNSMHGTTYQLGRASLAFKPSETETEGAYSMVELLEPPGANVALHRHPGWKETFVVLGGTFDFEAAGERRSMGPGEMLVIPRGAPHGFTRTSSETGRLLTISIPARCFEAGVAEVCAANVDTGSPGGGAVVDMRAIAARHGIEFL